MDSTTDAVLEQLLNKYKKDGRPISVSFRKLVNVLPGANRATHLIHTYPAKLLMHIPYFFLNNDILSKPGDTVLDPFCGSGTVLLESVLHNRCAVGSDANPLARLISSVKTTPIDPGRLRSSITRLKDRIPLHPSIEVPDVVNINYWFHPHVTEELTRLWEAIQLTRDIQIRAFFQVCFSSCVRKVSLADPRLSVPVKLRVGQYPPNHRLRQLTDDHVEKLNSIDVLEQFDSVLKQNFNRLVAFHSIVPPQVTSRIISQDARNLHSLSERELNDPMRSRVDTVDLVITSPPYVGAQKYIRASSLSLGWLGICSASELRALEEATVGREHHRKEQYRERVITGVRAADNLIKEIYRINPLRAHIAATYLVEMRDALKETARVTKLGGYVVLVVGNNEVCSREFKTSAYLRAIAEEMGLTLVLRLIDDIKSRGLMTKRNRTASLITREWVLVFQKSTV